MRGKTFIISGPSGAGKSTVLKELFRKRKNLYFSVSATTRAPRAGEEDGVAYHFLTPETFREWVEKDEFLEYAEFVEHSYGTYQAHEIYETNPRIRRVMEQLIDGTLCPENPRMFQEIYHSLLFGDGGGMADPYFVLKDLTSYITTQKKMLRDYDDRDLWLKKAVLNTASSSLFTSDRTIEEYNRLIWHLTPLKL